MNIHQASYLLGRGVHECFDFVVLHPSTAFVTYNMASWKAQAAEFPDETNRGWLLLAELFWASYAVASGIALGFRFQFWRDQKTAGNEVYKLENANKIVIDDSNGLEALLEKTRKGSWKEWGTVFRVHDDDKRAVISEIVAPSVAKEDGLVTQERMASVWFNLTKMKEEGYNGRHHYHSDIIPKILRGLNYAISPLDRSGEFDHMNLLSFRMPSGPELIGYNKRFVYLPTDSSKKELIKASPRDVWNYLEKKR